MTGSYRIHRSLFQDHDFETINIMHREQGFIGIKFNDIAAKIYTPQLALIFSKKLIPTTQQGTKLEIELQTYPLLELYIQGFLKGVADFTAKFGTNPNVLYGENAKELIRDIHMNYHHIQHSNIFEGWKAVKNIYPQLINKQQLIDFGYYSGIVSKVDEMRDTYPTLFNKYDRCDPDVKIEIKGLATFLFHRTDFTAPAKHNVVAWKDVLIKYHVGTFSPKSLAKVYYEINKSSNRISTKSDRNLQDALILFGLYPDPEGLKTLQAEIKEQKKGTVPK